MHPSGHKLFCKSNLFVLIVYSLFFGLFYLVYPLNGSLFGDFDTWANLAMFMELKAYLSADPSSLGTFLYPEEHSWITFSLSFFSGIIWVIFSFLGFDYIWAYWFYMVFIISLNAFSLYILVGNFIQSNFFKFIVGITVFVHPIFFVNLDNPNIISYFFAFLALHFLIRFLKFYRFQNIFWFSLLMSLQMYAAPIVFAYSFFLSLIVLLYYGRFFTIKMYQGVILALFNVFVFILPFLYFYIYQEKGLTALENLDDYLLPYFYQLFSLRLIDFIRPIPSHLIYGVPSEIYKPFVSLKHIFPGILMSFCLLLGLKDRKNALLYFVIIVFFILGSGHYMVHSDLLQLKSPFYFFYTKLGFENVLRIPSRFNLIILFFIVLVVFRTLDQISRKSQQLLFLAYTLGIFVFIESTLWKKELFSSKSQLAYFDESNKFMESQNQKEVITLNLPTGIIFDDSDKREFFYMINRVSQKNNTVNGCASFFPKERLDLWHLLDDLTLKEADFCTYIHQREISHVLVYKELAVTEVEAHQVKLVDTCDCLSLQADLQHAQIYRVLN